MSFHLPFSDFRVLEHPMRRRDQVMTAEVEKMKLHKRVTRAHATQVRIIVLTGTKTQHVAVELQKSPLKRRR